MKRAYILSIVTLAVILAPMIVIWGCGGDDDGGGPSGPAPPFNGTVSVQNNRFEPRDVTINVGETITWRWDGGNGHSVTEGTVRANPNALFDSGVLTTGTFSFTFTSEGVVDYHCVPHFSLNMKGTVTVVMP